MLGHLRLAFPDLFSARMENLLCEETGYQFLKFSSGIDQFRLVPVNRADFRKLHIPI